MAATIYPDAHLLGLPVELRELIYYYLTADRQVLHLQDSTGPLHLSAACTPPSNLLRAHPMLYVESTAQFHRMGKLTLHVDAFRFAKLQDPNDYTTALEKCRHVQHARNLELRLTMNAHIDFLTQAIMHTVPVLLSPSVKVKSVTVTWAEAVHPVMQRLWRPWACKAPALESIWDLLGTVDVKCGGVVNPPPAFAEEQEKGFQKAFDLIVKYKALSEAPVIDGEIPA